MNQKNTRIIRLTVATASFLAIITMGSNWTEEYFRLRTEMTELNVLQIELEDVRQRGQRLEKIEHKLNGRLSELLKSSITPETTGGVRESLIAIVRQNNCRLRSLDVNPGLVRPWILENDDPTRDATEKFAEESDFLLYQHEVELRADGTADGIKRILRNIDQERWFMSTLGLIVAPTGQKESPVSIEMRLILYGLGPKPDDYDADFATVRSVKLRR